MSYKIIIDKKVVDVLDSPIWVKENKRGLIVRCESNEAIGVISSDNSKTYHILGKQNFSKEECENVIVCDITEEEAQTLKTILEVGGNVTVGEFEEKIEFEQEEPIEEDIDGTLKEVREKVVQKMSNKCKEVICNGVDVVLSSGETKHFDYSAEDQLNLMFISNQITNGETSIIFHASDELCQEYNADDLMLIINAEIDNKTYHMLYFNSLRNWIMSMRSISKICAVQYGDAIPEKYCSEAFLKITKNQ